MSATAVSDRALAIGLERLVSLIRRLAPPSSISLTAASTLATLMADGPLGISDLAAREGVTQPGMTQLVSRLEGQGLARRSGHAADRRVVLVGITAAGRQLMADRRALRAEQLSLLLDQLPADDRDAIATALPGLTRLTELAATEPVQHA
ncbi:MAG: MarR family transcriptional regulator [Mycobacteriales bacterium]